MSTGFLYYVSVTGITGQRQALPADLAEEVTWLKQQTELPICIGFGIASSEHVRLLAPVAYGLIVDSAIVRRIVRASHQPRAELPKDVGNFASELLAALNG